MPLEFDGPKKKMDEILRRINLQDWKGLREFLGRYRGEYAASLLLRVVLEFPPQTTLNVCDQLERALYSGSTVPEIVSNNF